MDDVKTIALDALEEVKKQKEIKRGYHEDRAQSLEQEIDAIDKKLTSLRGSK